QITKLRKGVSGCRKDRNQARDQGVDGGRGRQGRRRRRSRQVRRGEGPQAYEQIERQEPEGREVDRARGGRRRLRRGRVSGPRRSRSRGRGRRRRRRLGGRCRRRGDAQVERQGRRLRLGRGGVRGAAAGAQGR